MNKQVVSLDLSRQLVEAGIKIDSEFWWEIHEKNDGVDDSAAEIVTHTYPKTVANAMNYYPAPLATEIAELLPSVITYDQVGEPMEYGNVYLVIEKGDEWWVGYQNSDKAMFFDGVQDKSLCDALAKMLIYLKKEGLI